jgi:hypothetical protein
MLCVRQIALFRLTGKRGINTYNFGNHCQECAMSSPLSNDEIAHLSKADLRRLKSQVDFQLGRDKAPIDRDGQVIYQALRKACRMASFNSAEKLVAQIGHGMFAAVIEYVNDYIDEACGKAIRQDQRAALTETLFRCLAAYLRDRDEAPTAIRMCEQIEALPFAVDRQFPGYAESKMLHFVVRSHNEALAA